MKELLLLLTDNLDIVIMLLAIPSFFWYLKKITNAPSVRLEKVMKETDKRNEKRFDGIEKVMKETDKRNEKRFDGIEEVMKETDKRNEKRFDGIEESIFKLSDKVSEIKESVIKNSADISMNRHAINILNKFYFGSNENLSGKLSPLCLTKQGEDIASELKIEELVSKYANDWLDQLDIPINAHKLVIEETCITFCNYHLLDKVSSQEAGVIMDAIYQGKEERSDYLRVYGIMFRDIVFKQRGLEVPKREKET